MTNVGHTTELKAGELLDGKYRVIKLLGAGGMGAVYAAKRLALGDVVAIKCILASQNSEANRARFIREARAVARIRHPHVVQVFDFGEPAGRSPYMVMEYLEGPTLGQLLKERGRLSADHALRVFSAICAAVEAGHRRGVVHRDLKPGNVILARTDDGRETVKVLDFGLARMTTNPGSIALTNPGSMLGTCNYMAPEQIEGAASGPTCDVFSLGVILYELVTGKLPFAAKTQLATMLRIAEGKYDSPQLHVPDLSPNLIAGIEASLSNDPQKRPPTPEALADLVGASFARPQVVDDAPSWPSSEDLASADLNSLAEDATMAEYGSGGDQTMVGDASLASAGPNAECFVCRDEEMDLLRREFQASAVGKGRAVVVTGAAGVGKSRLAERFCAWAERNQALVFSGRFFAYEGDRPPPHETFLRMLVGGGDSAEHDLARENRPGGVREDLGQDKWQAFSVMERAFVERARGRTLVVMLDDLQWASALDLDFLSHLTRSGDVRAMVLGTARTHGGGAEFQRWMAAAASQRALARVWLDAFAVDDVREWLVASFGTLRIHPRDIRRLHHATGGNPYYLSEVVRGLVDDGQISRGESGWSCASLANVELPETVNSVVRAKLDALDPDLRGVLETACVVGEEFRFETLEAATGLEEDALERHLEDAVAGGVLSEQVTSPGSDFRFETPTVHRVLYSSMSNRKRRRVHRKVVEALEQLYAADADRIAKILCYHFHAVADWAATLRWGLLAAREALSRHDNDHAEASLRRAEEAMRALDEDRQEVDKKDRAALSLMLGRLSLTLGDYERADKLLREATALADETQDDAIRLDGLLGLTECQLGRGTLDLGLTTGELAIELAVELGDRSKEFDARVLVARCAGPRGNLALAREVLGPVVSSDDKAHAVARALGWREMAWLDVRRGAFVEAESAAQQALKVARESGDALAEYQARSIQGYVYGEGGDHTRAVKTLGEALELARRLSLRRREGIELLNLGETQWLLGENDQALVRLQEALAIFVEVKDRATEGDCRVNLGRVLLTQGRRQEGLAMLEAGRAICHEAGRGDYAALAEIELGNAALADEDLERAGELLESAGRELEAAGSLYLWRAHLSLGFLALARGDKAQAAAAADTAGKLIEKLRTEVSAAMDGDHARDCVARVEELRASIEGA